MDSPPPPRRGWLRFSLRAFFALFTLACLLLGWMINPAIQQRQAINVIRLAGGGVSYEYEGHQYKWMKKPPSPATGGTLFGDLFRSDYFSDVIQVDFSDTTVKDISVLKKLRKVRSLNLNRTKVTDLSPVANLSHLQTLECLDTDIRSVSPLARLTKLQFVQLTGSRIADVAPLAGLGELQQLFLHGTQVRDISPLSNCQSLQYLGLRGTQVSDIKSLAKLKNLRWLDIKNTHVSETNVNWLGQALPNCVIEYSSDAALPK